MSPHSQTSWNTLISQESDKDWEKSKKYGNRLLPRFLQSKIHSFVQHHHQHVSQHLAFSLLGDKVVILILYILSSGIICDTLSAQTYALCLLL